MQLINFSIDRAHQHAAGGKRGSGSRHRPFSWRTNQQDPCRRRRAGITGSSRAHAGTGIRQGHSTRPAGRASAASVVVADRGYDWQHLIDLVGQRGGQAHIPTQRDRKVQRSVDPNVYRQRNSSSASSASSSTSDGSPHAKTSSQETSSPPSLSHQQEFGCGFYKSTARWAGCSAMLAGAIFVRYPELALFLDHRATG